jgi:outer membrane protein OmpA-like peptidoglycan-associated protein
MKFNFLFAILFLFELSFTAQQKVSVYFDFNSSELKNEETEKILSLIATSKVDVTKIVSYTDTFGTKKYNNKLATNRLNAVLNQFKPENLLSSKSEVRGEVYLDKSEAVKNYKGWRRVDIFYTSRPFNEPIVTEIVGVIEEKKEEIVIETSNEKFKELLSSDSPKTVALDVKFFGGLAEFVPTSMPDLQSFYDFLNENTEIKILIRGHVCCMKDYELSVLRAQAVYTYLVNRGIDPKRLTYKGFSNTLPVVFPEITEEDKSLNRRVDVEIVR